LTDDIGNNPVDQYAADRGVYTQTIAGHSSLQTYSFANQSNYQEQPEAILGSFKSRDALAV